MFGLILCFVIPGLLAGFLLSESFTQAKHRVRKAKQLQERAKRNKLFIYDLRSDLLEEQRVA